jgi:hypothetical protein
MRQDFRESVGQVVNGDLFHTEHHHAPVAKQPHELHAARVCPQCRQATWRLTQHCMHCKIDLFDWDRTKAYQIELATRRAERQQLVKGAMALLCAGMVLIVVGTMIESSAKSGCLLVGFGLAVVGLKALEMKP